jgi:hypothetical protein
MKITRYGDPCPLCGTPLLLDVLQVRSGQYDFLTAERVTRRQCPGGCHVNQPEQWKEAIHSRYGDC